MEERISLAPHPVLWALFVPCISLQGLIGPKRDLQAELLGLAPKHELKDDAVPLFNLPEKRENVQVVYPPTEERSAARKLAHARAVE